MTTAAHRLHPTAVAADASIGGVDWAHAYWTEGPRFVAEGYADGGAVGTWPDEIGDLDLVQPTGTQQPLYRAAEVDLSNRPAIDADGVDDNVGWTSPVAAIGPPWSLVYIGTVNPGSAGVRVMQSASTSGTRAPGTASTKWSIRFDHSAVSMTLSPVANQGELVVVVGLVGDDALLVGADSMTDKDAGDEPLTQLLAFGRDGGLNVTAGAASFIGAYNGDVRDDPGYSTLRAWAASYYGVSV